jgi:branched-chain amino acid transport system substrate-binding protein
MKKGILFSMLGLFLVIAPLYSVCNGAPAPEAKELKIGAIWTLSGPGSEAEINMRDGELLAQKWINTKGGVTIKGEKYLIKVIVEDSKGSSGGAAAAANKLVFREKVKFITGCLITPHYFAGLTVTEPNKVLLVTPQAVATTPDHPYLFSSADCIGHSYKVLYPYLRKTYPGVKTVALMYEDNPGSKGVTEIAAKAAAMNGIKVVTRDGRPTGTMDVYPSVTRVLRFKPDAIDVGLNRIGNAAATIKAVRELGFKGPMLACNDMAPDIIRDIVGKKSATDFFLPTVYRKNVELPAITKEIIKLWGDTYKTAIWNDAFQGWDSLWTLMQAIEKTQSLDPTEVMKTWEKMEAIETKYGTGKMGGLKTFGLNHVVIPPCPISYLENGEIKFGGWYEQKIP